MEEPRGFLKPGIPGPCPCAVQAFPEKQQQAGPGRHHSAPFSTTDSDALLGLREDTLAGQRPQQWAFSLPLGVSSPPHRLYPTAVTGSCPSLPQTVSPSRAGLLSVLVPAASPALKPGPGSQHLANKCVWNSRIRRSQDDCPDL